LKGKGDFLKFGNRGEGSRRKILHLRKREVLFLYRKAPPEFRGRGGEKNPWERVEAVAREAPRNSEKKKKRNIWHGRSHGGGSQLASKAD